jgi:hypothetical protein
MYGKAGNRQDVSINTKRYLRNTQIEPVISPPHVFGDQ